MPSAGTTNTRTNNTFICYNYILAYRRFKIKYYIAPPLEIYVGESGNCYQEPKITSKTYAEYNYLRPGIASYVKSIHFDVALKLVRQFFYRCNVIDFGCADGVFLPSLSKYFNLVCGVDKNPNFIKIAQKLVDMSALSNVKLICNEKHNIVEIKRQLADEKYNLLFLLEIIEHVGRKEDLYASKVEFIEQLFALIDEEGIIVISVPKMVGIAFLMQRIALALFGLYRSPMSISNIVKASFFNNTSDLERQWKGEHEGFNHKKLENHLGKNFNILKKRNLLFQVIYVIKRNPVKQAK
ncbi:hypothetical protein A2276_05830 [candidate division WOR-1 bacterium RIFOXYA12_FULL_43_27]|uniref:Methyltransferase domain-containing protein n=1 Tax=candidate division WOR-1 bacterium RIFOXYC2_FULL_46_14 TaxID=1802587 RepID=A0A1F4U5B9_UNCSA|nr:MAG: hypothetical protein A2276_05830 [candidate division WOR-1 bacterium RIFOXYA12_FULL_43_27]OGC20181.1 MAG: hypothetical protein A2292_03830 [candidate division WOR-1 bacterium RIFOXYB2_FULL_46_45]OGC32081.1 MAG: hypothetical protein A2232_07615 [candidate division WOR-1 bacterium RIFOXYA2_FULL_46_56]OGC39483.1 MAG: hypothetical protein A2438_07980 [candidate division WOR-1 bacterium RIFOXYC2_FULL_46_14]